MAVNDLITFRKGTASQWTSVNPVLASGEPGYDLTNSVLKIGDGVSNWVSLSGIGSTSVSNIVAGSGIGVSSTSGIFTVSLDAYSVLIGDGSATSYTVTHNLGATNDVHVSVRETGTNYYVYPDVKYVNSNSVIIEFSSAPTSNQYRVSIIGF